MTRFARRFRRISRRLSRVQLMRSSMDETFDLTADELLDKNAGRRFLDFYGDEGLLMAFGAYGILRRIEKRGWGDLGIETNALDERHTLILSGRREDEEPPERLFELVVRRDRLTVDVDPAIADPGLELGRSWEVITVDWLTLRDPGAPFAEPRYRLPGQDAPGLGVGERILEMLQRVVDRLELDGLVTVAEYFHNAVLYHREMPYVDPDSAGQLLALERLLLEQENLTLSQATWAVDWGYVLDEADASVVWRGEAMVKATEKDLATHLASPAHREAAEQAAKGLRYRLHRSAFEEHWARERERLLEYPEPEPVAAASPEDEGA